MAVFAHPAKNVKSARTLHLSRFPAKQAKNTRLPTPTIVEKYRADRRSRTPGFLAEIKDEFERLDGDLAGFESTGLREIE